MNCEEFEKNINDYLTDKNFDAQLKEAMAEHYFECEDCFNKLELTSVTIGVIQAEGIDKLLQYSEVEDEALETIFTVFLDGVQQTIKQIRKVLISDLLKTGKLVIKLGEKVIFEEDIEESQILMPTELSPSHRLKEQKPSITFRHSGFIFEVRPGQDGGKLTIKLTDNLIDE